MDRRFAAFILTHGRPDNVVTFDALRKHGYTGPIYLVIDNEDEQGDEYRRRFGDEQVIEFDKTQIATTFDTADTASDRRTIVYARNACFDIATRLGLTHFVEFDDDYNAFRYRVMDKGHLRSPRTRRLDAVIEATLDFLDASNADCVSWSQPGDLIGGVDTGIVKLGGVKRKAMNSLFLRTDRRVTFVGRINEDVNTYVLEGSRGKLFMSVMDVDLVQALTQHQQGGMTDVYIESGTYLKSFYTVMMHPSSVRIGSIGMRNRRFHHRIDWDATTPKILNARHRKAA